MKRAISALLIIVMLVTLSSFAGVSAEETVSERNGAEENGLNIAADPSSGIADTGYNNSTYQKCDAKLKLGQSQWFYITPTYNTGVESASPINSDSKVVGVSYSGRNSTGFTATGKSVGTATVSFTVYSSYRNDFHANTVDFVITVYDPVITVYLDADGGSVDSASIKINVDESDDPDDLLPDPYRSGYFFTGWYLDGDYVSKVSELYDGCTLNAGWVKKLNISFDPAGGSVSPTSTVVGKGRRIGSMPVPVREGYVFDGWYTESGEEITSSSSFSDDTTLYAHWRTAITISYDGSGGVTSPVSVIIGSGKNIGTLPVPTRGGYVFDGWYTDDGEEVSKDTVFIEGAALHARWLEETVVFFDLNGGSLKDPYSEEYTVIGKGKSVTPMPQTYREGYSFVGWYSSEDDSGVPVTETTVFDKDAVIYARWKIRTDYYTYTVTDSKATVTGYTGTDRNILIPAEIDGYPVKAIGERAFANEPIVSISIDSSVSKIGAGAFDNCSSLKKINLPDSITAVESGVFGGCRSLKEIFLPEKVSSIGSGAFENCSSLTEIYLSDNITTVENRAFRDCKSLTGIYLPEKTSSVGSEAFYGCASLKHVSYHDTVGHVGENAFYDTLWYDGLPDGLIYIGRCLYKCKGDSPEGVYIANGTKEITPGAFDGCGSLRNVILPDSVKRISAGTFGNCTSLIYVEIPDSITAIDEGAFRNCKALTTIDIPASAATIGDSAFSGCTSLENILLPDSVGSIGKYAFSGCTSLSGFAFPDSVTSISDSVLKDSENVANVYIPDSVTSIGDCAFLGCGDLNSVIIPDSVTSLGEKSLGYGMGSSFTLYGYKGSKAEEYASANGFSFVSIGNHIVPSAEPVEYVTLTEDDFEYNVRQNNTVVITKYIGTAADVSIPLNLEGYTVKSIYDSAFEGCTNLRNVKMTNLVSYIGDRAFKDCTSLESITLSNVIGEIYFSTFENCSSLTKITIPDSVTKIWSSAFKGCTLLREADLPDALTGIGDYSFKNCSSLRKVKIPRSVVNIGDAVFENCLSLKDVVLPDTLTSIPRDMFNGCRSLTEADIPDSVTNIGINAFRNCRLLMKADIPDSVTEIDQFAFSGCESLTEISLPDSVKNTGKYAGRNVFSECSNLKRVRLSSSMESIDSSMFSNCSRLDNVVIPDSVKSIEDNAFRKCGSLTNVYIPNSVTDIYKNAFDDCTKLKSVVIPASVVNIGDMAFGYYTGNTEKKVDGFTVYGYSGSAAERYAESSGFSFVNLTDDPAKPTVQPTMQRPTEAVIQKPSQTPTQKPTEAPAPAVTEAPTQRPTMYLDMPEAPLPTASETDEGILIKWSAVPGVQKYRVYYLDNAGIAVKHIGETSSDSYLDKGAKGGVTYRYAVGYRRDDGFYYYDPSRSVTIRSNKPAEAPTAEPTQAAAVLLGDVNGDGEVDMIDATVIQRAVTRINEPYTQEQLMNADIDGDGGITIVDATFIQRYSTGVKTPYKIGEAIG